MILEMGQNEETRQYLIREMNGNGKWYDTRNRIFNAKQEKKKENIDTIDTTSQLTGMIQEIQSKEIGKTIWYEGMQFWKNH